MQLLFFSPSLTEQGMPYKINWARKGKYSIIDFRKEPGISIIYANKSSTINFRLTKISAPVKYELANEIKPEANRSHENI